jgi:hypothetical protein
MYFCVTDRMFDKFRLIKQGEDLHRIWSALMPRRTIFHPSRQRALDCAYGAEVRHLWRDECGIVSRFLGTDASAERKLVKQ